MLFISGEAANGDGAGDVAERGACIRAACHGAATVRRPESSPPVLAQALLERHETPQAAGLEAAGFLRLGELAYLAWTNGSSAPVVEAPPGIELASFSSLSGDERDELLVRILKKTYIETQDCPELCGLRDARDVLDSHRAVGAHDPNLWWLLFDGDPSSGGEPEGCMLLNPCPEQDSVELVYLGLAPALRGRGIAAHALAVGLHAMRARPEARLTCAVDTRNTPAMRLYDRFGFERIGGRVPFVRAIGS
jgi:ribosomal protein S18 acetylase RimI-like enzyme